jgi:LmbE family N-acetylglucosaminyl deacetylase
MTDDKLEHVPEDWERALAIVAHPDDLEYGASSAVAKWTAAGKHVAYVLATRGEAGINAWPPERVGPVREAEELESARLVGVETVEFLDYRDGMVEYGLPLRRDLARAIRRHRPDAIITGNFELAWPGGALNQADHRAVGLAACDAARDAGNRWIFPELTAEGLEPWGGTRRVFVNAAVPSTHACDVGEALERGIASLKAHRAYFENLGQEFDPDTFLRQSAARVGARLGCRYAVEFRVLSL